MAAIIRKGGHVYVFAYTYFDDPNRGNALSRSLFACNYKYNTTKYHGTVLKVTCICASVLWNVDETYPAVY